MSAESENGKTAPLEKNEKDVKQSEGIENDKKPTVNKPEKGEDTKPKDEEKKEDTKSEEKVENNKDSPDAEKDTKDEKDKNDVKDDKKDKNKDKSDAEDSGKEENVEDEEEEEEENNDDEQDDGDDVDDKKGKKTSPKKKGSQKNLKDSKNEEDEDDETGLELGDIPRIDASISRFKNDDLKLLHKLLYKSPIKTALLKKNIRKFGGFSFKKSSDEYQKKLSTMGQFEVKQLRIICEMLDLEKKGNRDELSERILDFLIEPKDSGKPAGGGRPRRSAAVKANNRGYSDEEYSSDERASPRAKRNAGRRTNLKDETSTEESDEDFQPSEESEEDKPRVKRGRAGRRKKNDSEEEEESVEDSEDTDYSDEGPKGKQRKVANNKAKGRGGGTPRGRGRPASTGAAKRKTPARRGRKKQESSEEEEESEHHDEASSSEDEPLAKKSAKNPTPPTDDEIKTYVKEILDGANLEEITMKTVCKQVYAHYPDFDLTHKKDYIKNTVKSLIST